MDVVDFHAHFFSRTFFETLAGQSPLPGSTEAKMVAAASAAGIELPPADVSVHLARWIEELDRHGVGHMVAFASVPEEAATLADAARQAKGRISPVAVVNPRAPGAPERTEELLANHGFKGVLLFPAMHHFDLSGPEARAVYAVLSRHRAVAYAHCGLLVVRIRDHLGLPRPYDVRFANPLSLIPAANAEPEATFVIPHFGAGYFRETLMLASQCENVCVDTSSSNSWMKLSGHPLTLAEVYARSLDVLGSERVLFGTDSNVFPAGWRADRLDAARKALAECGASEEDERRVLGANARRLLGE